MNTRDDHGRIGGPLRCDLYISLSLPLVRERGKGNLGKGMRIRLAIVPTPNRAREILFFGYPDSWCLLDQVLAILFARQTKPIPG